MESRLLKALEHGFKCARSDLESFLIRRGMYRLDQQLRDQLRVLQVKYVFGYEVAEKYIAYRDRVIRQHMEEILEYAGLRSAMEAPILFLSLEEFDHYQNPDCSRSFYEKMENMPLVVQEFVESFSKRGMYLAARAEESGRGLHVVVYACIDTFWEYPHILPEPLYECPC